MFQTRLPLCANQHLCFNAYAILRLVGYGSKRFLFSPSFLLLPVSLKHLPNNLSGAIIIGMQATSEVAYLFPYNSFFFPPFLFPLLPFRPFLSSLFLMFRWWGASELNLMQGTREKTRGDWVESKETRFIPFFTLVSCLFFPLVNFSPAPHHLNAWNWLLLIQPPLPRILSLLQRPCFICISRYNKLEAILILSSVDNILAEQWDPT